MAFDKREINELTRILILIIVALPWSASAITDCGGKAFHCINSTHFMICVDLGGGVSSTIDSFVIPCPPSTGCRETNRFECEFLEPEMRELFTNTFVPDLTELPLTTAVPSTSSATIFTQVKNDIGALSTTELPQYTTVITATNTTAAQQPNATIEISVTNTTEFFQASTDITAYNTTESIQSSTDIFATELPPTTKYISAPNISLALTEFPQASTGYNVPNLKELIQGQSVSITTERFQDSTVLIEANPTELPPTPRDTPTISQVPTEFMQASIHNSAPNQTKLVQTQASESVSITTERFQASTELIKENATELPLAPEDITAPNISQAPIEFKPVTDISASNQTELFQAQKANSVYNTTERFQASTDVIAAYATERPLAPIYISATNNISEMNNISIDLSVIATTMLPKILTDITASNTIGVTQAPMDTIAPNITKSQAQDNGEHSTTEFSKIITNNIATNTLIDISTRIIKENYEASTENISASIINETSQGPTNKSATNTTELPQALTDTSTNNKTERFQKTTEANMANTNNIFQTLTNISATNTTEQSHILTEIGASNTTEFLQATTDTAYKTTESLQTLTNISSTNATEFPLVLIDFSALNISQAPIEFPQEPTDVESTYTSESSQSSTDNGVLNTTEFPQTTKIWSPDNAITFKPDREVNVLPTDDNIVSKKTTQESVTDKSVTDLKLTSTTVAVISGTDPFINGNEKPNKSELTNDKKIKMGELINNDSTMQPNDEIALIAGKLEVPTISTTAIDDLFDVQSKVPTDSTTFDTTQTNANTLSQEVITESVSTVNVNTSANYNIVDTTRLTSEVTLSLEISAVSTDLNIINPEVSSTPSIVQRESIHSSTSQVSSNEAMYNNSEVTPTLSYLNKPQKDSVNYNTDTTENYSITTGNPLMTDNNILVEIKDSITQLPFSYETFTINDKVSTNMLDENSKSTRPNETTYKNVTTESYENLTPTLVIASRSDSITQNFYITTSGPIPAGYEEVSTDTFVEPTTFDVNAYTKSESNGQVHYENSKDRYETNVTIFEHNISTTTNQSRAIGLEVTQASVEIEKLFIPTWSSVTSETIITKPTVRSNTEEKLQAVTAKSTETSSGIDPYTPIQHITNSNQYSFNGIANGSKFETNMLTTITSQSTVQQNLNSKQNSFNYENIAQVTNLPEESTKVNPYNMAIVTNQHANIPMVGHTNRQSSENQAAVTEQYTTLSTTNDKYFDKVLSTSAINKKTLMANTGIEQGFVTEPYTTKGLKYISDVPVSTTGIGRITATTKEDFQQDVTKHKAISTADLHATVSPWGLNTILTSNMEQRVDIEQTVKDIGRHGFTTVTIVPDADSPTASQNTLIEQGVDLGPINASLLLVDNVQSITRNTTETDVGTKSITPTSSTNSISNEMALPVSYIELPVQNLVEQNVDTGNMVFTNTTDLNGKIVSNSPIEKIRTEPLSNINIRHDAHYVQYTVNETVRSPADNVPTITDIGIPGNRTTSLSSANKQNESHNNQVLGQFEVTVNNISTQNITTLFNKDSNDTNVFLSYENGIHSSLQNITNSTESNAMPIITQITLQNSTDIVDVTQDSTNDRDSNLDKVQNITGSNMNGSNVSTITDNLSHASLDQFMNFKQETPKYTSLNNEDLKLLPDLPLKKSSIKGISIQRSDESTSTLDSNVDSIIPDKTSSASTNVDVIVNSQVTLDINDRISLSSRDSLAGSEFLITTEHIVDEKINLNQEKSIGNMKEEVKLSPLLDLMQSVTRKTAEVPKIKFTGSPRISSIEFGNPRIESKSSTQSSIEKVESLLSISDAAKTLSKHNFQPSEQKTQGRALISTPTSYTITQSLAGLLLNDTVISPNDISVQNVTNTEETLARELIKISPIYNVTNDKIGLSTVTKAEYKFTRKPPNEVKQIIESHNKDINLSISSHIENSNAGTKLYTEIDHHAVTLLTKSIETSTQSTFISKDETQNVLKSKETNINDSNKTNIEPSIQSSTATNKENNLKLQPSLGHENTSSKIKSSKPGIINHPKSSVHLYCRNRNRGRYSDREDCSKFYICIGRLEPIIGRCPANTVFSDIKKQCTKNKSHCIRESEFKCTFAGRYSDILQQNIYYICVKSGDVFIRFKFQCQNGYHLNKTSVKCDKQSHLELQQHTSISLDSKSEKSTNDDRSTKHDAKHDKQSNKSVEEFQCKEEGRFGDANNCRKYYVCTKRNKKSEFRRRKKKCDSDEVFHKKEKKCVDAESYEC